MHTPKEIYEWLERIRFYIEDPNSDSKVQLMEYMQDLKTYIGAFEQIEWERNVAISQLRNLGYDLGQKTDMQKIYDDIYPLTVVMDRYNGTYSGGAFTAWNLDVDDVPWQICSSDGDALDIFMDIRDGYKGIVYGVGNTPDLAVKDLWNKLKKKDN